MKLDTVIGRLFAPYSPGGRHTPWSSILAYNIELWHCEITFEASIKKAQNGPSTQLIKAMSCVERSNATIYSLTPIDSGGNEKLPPHRYRAVGIVQETFRTSTQLHPQTSSPW